MSSLGEEYSQRYKRLNRRQRLNKLSHALKLKLLLRLSKSKFSKKLQPHDIVMLNQKKVHDRNDGIDGFNIKPNLPNNYTSLSLKELHFFEAVEIDKFDLYRSRLARKFGADNPLIAAGKRDLKEDLAKVKVDLDTISWGKLGLLNLSKRRSEKNDLIEYIDISYIKTNESFFILKFRVIPSVFFQKQLDKILSKNDTYKIEPHFLSFAEILKIGTFYSHETFVNSVKWKSICDLISDLQFQLVENLKNSIEGVFLKNSSRKELPRVEYYEVDDLVKFHEDRHLSVNFERKSMFTQTSGKTEIYFPQFDKNGLEPIHIIKQSGYNIIESKDENRVVDHNRIDSHFLLRSLSFPCVFKAILQLQREEINRLKREIYDFIDHSSKRGVIASFFFFISNRKYIKLKLKLTRISLAMKRFENEFSERNLLLYTTEFDLSNFSEKGQDRNLNFLQEIVDGFLYQLGQLEKKKEDINTVFKSIEEVNSYRTNLLLQVISIFIGVVALLLAFDKVKEFFSLLYEWLLNMF